MQQQIDDNGMVFNAPMKIIFKDIETGTIKSEEVSYADGCAVMKAKSGKNDMVNLPKAGWIKTSCLQKFANIYREKKNRFTESEWENPTPVLERTFDGLQEFLKYELKRVTERCKKTNLPDPRTRVYARLLECKTREEIVAGLRKFWSEGEK